ncbi:MAG: hypothetical protein KA715_12670 [Xanthomonadaceae bacterium]|nr:hypothetical protein [Xanthomonadaceae bacterium]
MKTLSTVILGLALSAQLLAPLSHAGDCMQIAIQTKHDLEQTLNAIEAQPGYIDRNSQNMGYAEYSHVYTMTNEIYRQGLLIDLYNNAFEDECIGQVKDLYNTLVKRGKRKSKGIKAFSFPSCDELMDRIDQGRTGEFCPRGKTYDFNVDAIRKTIEKENRRKK